MAVIHRSSRERSRSVLEPRVMAANAAAWAYLSLPTHARRGREYLLDRGIDVAALEVETGRPVVGHTPYKDDGLVSQLRSEGFTDDELVDAGWGARRGGEMTDRFRRRVITPSVMTTTE